MEELHALYHQRYRTIQDTTKGPPKKFSDFTRMLDRIRQLEATPLMVVSCVCCAFALWSLLKVYTAH